MKGLFFIPLFSSALIFAAALAGHDTALAQERFSRAALVADLDTLVKTIEEVHPDPYTVISRKQFHKNAKRVKKELRDSMNVVEFWAVTVPLVSSIGDGHTTLSLPWEYFEDNPDVFPYALHLNPADSSLIVSGYTAGQENEVPLGARITGINGLDGKAIARRLLSFVSGESTSFKAVRLNYSHLYMYAIDPADTFVIGYTKDGMTGVRTAPALPLSEWQRTITYGQNTRENIREIEGLWDMQIDSARSTAIIDFRSFRDNEQWGSFLDSSFRVIHESGIENLIVDLRYNGGGNSNAGNRLFQYIAHVPFAQFGPTVVKYSDPLRDYYAGAGFIPDKNGIHYEDAGQLIKLSDTPLRFGGKAYLLTSQRTFSSASKFAWAFHYFKMGTIVGTETGGWIVTFGDMCPQELPNTGISYGVSWKRFTGYGSEESMTHGVYPDVEVPAAQALDKALELIVAGK